MPDISRDHIVGVRCRAFEKHIIVRVGTSANGFRGSDPQSFFADGIQSGRYYIFRLPKLSRGRLNHFLIFGKKALTDDN